MKTKMYLHSSKKANSEQGAELELTGAALEVFRHALYEVEFDVDVNEETGDVTILAVNNHKLETH